MTKNKAKYCKLCERQKAQGSLYCGFHADMVDFLGEEEALSRHGMKK